MDVQVYKGTYHISPSPHSKHIIFDLDETIGCFNEIYLLWYVLSEYNQIHHWWNVQETQSIFDKLLSLFPEVFRYGIHIILQFLHHKQQQGICGNIYIYSNNQHGKEWIQHIVQFLETSCKTPHLFHQVIGPFKIDDIIVEPLRTTNEKTYNDFVRCSSVSKISELCFIDDTFFKKMKHARVFYIQPKPYYHSLDMNTIMTRFFQSSFCKSDIIKEQIIETLDRSHSISFSSRIKTKHEHTVDVEVSKKILAYLQEFFQSTCSKPKTRKHRKTTHGTRKCRDASMTKS